MLVSSRRGVDAQSVRLAILGVLSFTLLAHQADASITIGFDDIISEEPNPPNYQDSFQEFIDPGYGGFTWHNVGVTHHKIWNHTWQPEAPSPFFVAYTIGEEAVIESPTLFNFHSVYMRSAWYDGELDATVVGLRDGIELYTKTVSLGRDEYSFVEFEYSGVDTVRLISTSGETIWFDDFTYSHAIPEPTSLLIWSAIALGGLGLAYRRRKIQRA